MDSVAAAVAVSCAGAASAQQIEEVIVTAQKRAEALQKVPIAVSAISAAAADAKGIQNTADLPSAIPGLVFGNSLNVAAPGLRGIGSTNANPGYESGLALYVDGVYLLSPSAQFVPFNNLERVELLKGPQGTLFGRNAFSGVLNIVTKTPSQTPRLDVMLGQARFNTTEANIYGSTGVAPNLATDIAVYWTDQRDGWGRNIPDNADRWTTREIAVRNKWFWSGERTQLTLSGDYDRKVTDQGVGLTLVPGSLGVDGVTTNQGFYNTTFTGELPTSRNEQWGVSLKADHESDAVHISNIVAYRSNDSYFVTMSDGTPHGFGRAQASSPLRQFTEELQVSSPDSGKIKWVSGVFYLHARAGYEPLNLLGSIFPPFAIVDRQTTESVALFAQATAPLGEDTNLTLGGRYTWDNQRFQGGFVFRSTGAPVAPPRDATKRDSEPTFKVALDHAFTSDVLGYVSFSRGYTGGLFNTIGPADAPVNAQTVDATEIGMKSTWLNNRLRLNASVFHDEVRDLQVTATTVSSSTAIAKLLNAARERSQGFDVEAELVPAENLTLTAGLAYTDAIYTSFPNAVEFTPNPSPLCPPPASQVGGNCTMFNFDATGKQAILTPKWAYNFGFIYRMPSEIGDFSLTANEAFTSKVYTSFGNRSVKPSYNMVDSALTWTSVDKTWSIGLWGRNLLDVQRYNYLFVGALGQAATPAAPRTFGLQVSVHFN